ncbi:MAG: acyl-CoA dehydrogenase family protein [Labilithrix sp.]|nr:acyl-CoA dehydrogenase family protein [Labilithrix sp.]MCW5810777.1 acyl-CoA dehydrogenase family protein [Labilithrix sp.]
MAFFQSPPELGNTYISDDVLRRYLRNAMPPDVLAQIEPELLAMGELSGGELFRESIATGREEPKLNQWNAWGRRVDEIELTPLWQKAQRITAEKGVVATAYERKTGAWSRVHQFALVYLIEPSWHVYSCPLAMTDGAAKTLMVSKNQALIDRALPRLTSRDPKTSWTSGQWMTERTGGSDVAICETIAKPLPEAGAYALSGTKWFSSATTSQMALTLGRPEGNPPGGSGLALFYLEVRNPDGTMNGISVNRLKDKLGTRMVPTAELTLDGARAVAVRGLDSGIKNITPMLHVTRTWNAVCAVAGMRRGLMLAKDYARRRVAFGATLDQKPLHLDTLATIEAEAQGGMLIAFRAVELLGKEEVGELTEEDAALLRILNPIVKLVTAKQAVLVASETLEAFGGAGYIEDTGFPRLLRDAQVLPIWEGTTNVLSLDLLRVLAKGGSIEPIAREVHACIEGADASLKEPAEAAVKAVEHAGAWLMRTLEAGGPAAVEAGARRLALTLGRAMELALLVREATRSKKHGDHDKAAAAARRYWRSGVDLILDASLDADARALFA